MIVFVTSRFLSMYDFSKIDDVLVYVSFVSDALPAMLKPNFSKSILLDSLDVQNAQKVVEELQFNMDSLVICNDDVNKPFADRLKFLLGHISQSKYKQEHQLADKVFQKGGLEMIQGINIPDYEILTVANNEAEVFKKNWMSAVIKPRVSALSKGLKIICGPNNWRSYLHENPNLFSGNYEVEEYIEGPMYHVDCLRSSNKEIFSIACKYNTPMGNFLQGNAVGSCILIEDIGLVKRLKQAARQICEAFSYQDGAAHIEFIVQQETGDVYFIEFARRFPGGLAIPLYNKMLSTNILNWEIEVMLKESVSLKALSGVGFWVLYTCYQGKVVYGNNLHLTQGFEVEYHRNLAIGSVINSSNSLSDRSAELLGYSSQIVCHKRLEEVFFSYCNFKPYLIESRYSAT